VPGIIPASSIRDKGTTIFSEILFRSFHTIYILAGMLISRSTGVVSLFDTANENRVPMTSVFPNPVIPLTKYASKADMKRNKFCSISLPHINYKIGNPYFNKYESRPEYKASISNRKKISFFLLRFP
jgi:hypothetical protein